MSTKYNTVSVIQLGCGLKTFACTYFFDVYEMYILIILIII